MKRFFFVLLIVVLVLASCDTGKSNKGIVSIRVEIESTRSMNITGSSIDPSEAVWTYRLIKEDGGFGYGEKKERVVMDGTSLTVAVALGEWTITIEGFKDDSFNEKVYYGKKTFVLGSDELDVVVDVSTITDSSLLEGKSSADFVLLPITKDFNLDYFEGEERELCAVWTVDDEVIEEWTLRGDDGNWHRNEVETISAAGMHVKIPAGKGRRITLTVTDGLGITVAKEGWEIDCCANCLYVVKGSMTKRGESLGLDIEINGNLPASEGVVSPIKITSYWDIDINKWESFKNATGFIAGFEIGEPQEDITYVEDLERAANFPIYTSGVYNNPVYYGYRTNVNALVIRDSETLCNSEASWAIFLANSGMTADSPVNESLFSAIVDINKTEITPYMFRNCTRLNSLKFDNFLGNSIGDYAFENCSSLRQVPTNDHIVRIGEGAFKGCASLQNYTVGQTTEYIGAEAFQGCTAMNITFEKRLSDGAWFVGLEKIMVNPSEIDSETLKQYITDIYSNEYWEWGQIPNAWNWVQVAEETICSYKLNPEEQYVRLYLNGRASKILYSGDRYALATIRTKVFVEFADDVWSVYHDDDLYGYFEYVTE